MSRVAVLEDGRLAEVFAERPEERERAGDIYLGTVMQVVPGLQAAFVDIGLTRNAYLYVDDLLPAHLARQPKDKPAIGELVSEGDRVLVQVKKEPSGTKGARVTTHFTLPGRWVVYMPGADYAAISRKIVSSEEKSRLKRIGEQLRRPGDGLILRTVAEGVPADVLEQDLAGLCEAWQGILEKAATAGPPALLYSDLELIPRLVRDLFTGPADELHVDDPETMKAIEGQLRQSPADWRGRVFVHTEEKPLFATFGIEEELDRLFHRKLWLESGGYLVIDQTEALTVIDVNTGKYTGDTDLEQTAFNTNREAAQLIARLVRLRDLGGMIVVDFIDMEEEEHRDRIFEVLEASVRPDRTRTNIVGWTKLGLFEMTRKKVRPSWEEQMARSCSHCGGTGRIHLLP
ncbi:hypothetical protein J31TS4_24850 [Paenibacillus sp. J31TS4]|nr:hypothetical protein J31TS4_24850 [Paenibacillus sp. J31TS4]